MGASSSHLEHSSGSPTAQARSGLLLQWCGDPSVRPSLAWVQRYAVLTSRKLHLFGSEPEALAWGTPLLVVDLANCAVKPQEASYQGSTFPPGTLLIETPSTPSRLELQNGLASVHLRVFGDEAAERIASREPWQADGEAARCPRCSSGYDLLNRRHHCRRCGLIVCEPCSAFAKPLPDLAYEEAVRVCRACHAESGPVPSAPERASRADEDASLADDLRKAARAAKRAPEKTGADAEREERASAARSTWKMAWPSYGLKQEPATG